MATTITPTIVNINTTVTVAAQPSQLQQSGAIVVAGGSTLAAGTYQYCGNLAAVTSIAAAPLPITGLAWASGVVTATVSAVGVTAGQTFKVTIAGAAPAAYNGTFVATALTATTFSYPLASNPGAETTPGTYTPPTTASMISMATTFFAQGSSVGVYVLELGAETTATAAISALSTWITENPGIFYAYLIPGDWDSSTLATLANNYSSPNGKTYFFATTTQANLAFYSGIKSVFTWVSSPTQASTEHQAASLFYQWLVNQPSAATPMAPLAFRYIYGVTPWNQFQNQTAINTVLTAYGNLALTGSEGGISTTCIFKGTTSDGEQGAWWYAVDWLQIQIKQALANAIINGSNSYPPLLYNQNGINTLQARAQSVANSAVTFGLALSATVSATSFAAYTAANPNDYNAGIYNGLSLTVSPQTGFESITFALDAVQFAI